MHMMMITHHGQLVRSVRVGRRGIVIVIVLVTMVTQVQSMGLPMFQRIANPHGRRIGSVDGNQAGKKHGKAGRHGAEYTQVGTVPFDGSGTA